MIPSLTSTCGGASTQDPIALTQHGKVGSISHAHDATRRLRPEAPYLLAPSLHKFSNSHSPVPQAITATPNLTLGHSRRLATRRSRARARVRRRTRCARVTGGCHTLLVERGRRSEESPHSAVVYTGATGQPPTSLLSICPSTGDMSTGGSPSYWYFKTGQPHGQDPQLRSPHGPLFSLLITAMTSTSPTDDRHG